MSNRVVITGLGVVSPVGIGKEAFWDSMMSGKNGIDKITRFDAAEYKAQIAGEVKDFDPADYMDKKESKRIDRYAQFAMAAAKLAVEDAKLDLEQENLERISDIRGEVTDNGFGSQIRSYVLQPYTMVKDKRTSYENSNVSAVLDGDLDGFMTAYLKWVNRVEV